MKKLLITLLFCKIGFISTFVKAEVVEANEGYFSIVFEKTFSQSAEKINDQIIKIEEWWHPGHTYSGKSENLFVDLKKRHCFCERLGNQGTVRHLDLVNYQPNKLIRFRGGLGPLQSIPVNGVLDFSLKTENDKTILKLTYKVSGNVPGLKPWSEPVNQVLAQQFERLVKKVEE